MVHDSNYLISLSLLCSPPSNIRELVPGKTPEALEDALLGRVRDLMQKMRLLERSRYSVDRLLELLGDTIGKYRHAWSEARPDRLPGDEPRIFVGSIASARLLRGLLGLAVVGAVASEIEPDSLPLKDAMSDGHLLAELASSVFPEQVKLLEARGYNSAAHALRSNSAAPALLPAPAPALGLGFGQGPAALTPAPAAAAAGHPAYNGHVINSSYQGVICFGCGRTGPDRSGCRSGCINLPKRQDALHNSLTLFQASALAGDRLYDGSARRKDNEPRVVVTEAQVPK